MFFPLLISAPKGRSGKTLVCLALILALRRLGYTVQAFKKGPDYIDPQWLGAASGRIARTLDPYLQDKEVIIDTFERAMDGADVALIEGAMGLFDGPEGPERGSTAELAKILNVPVLLVVDTERMTFSVAALLKGFIEFDRGLNIAGVILNRVSTKRHEEKLKLAIEREVRIPVLGVIPKDLQICIKERHLGLVPFKEEVEKGYMLLQEIEKRISGHLEIERMLEIGKRYLRESRCPINVSLPPTSFTIGVFFDRAFHFYYVENLEALRKEGARIVFIDAIHDKTLPKVDGLYIGGGFPELFLKELEANASLRTDIASKIESGLPVYAECAGLMYLCKDISWKGKAYKMVGAVDASCEIVERPVGHGYVEVEVAHENPIFPKGLRFRAHEFHHSKVRFSRKEKFVLRMERGYGIDGIQDGLLHKNTFCSYTHVNALANPFWAKGFAGLVKQTKKYQKDMEVRSYAKDDIGRY